MSLEDEIKEFQRNFMKDVTPQKKTTFSAKTEKHRQHNHFTQGKTGYVPHPSGDQVNIALAKRS